MMKGHLKQSRVQQRFYPRKSPAKRGAVIFSVISIGTVTRYNRSKSLEKNGNISGQGPVLYVVEI